MDITGQKFIRAIEIANGRLIVCTQAPGMDIETEPHTGLCYWSEDEDWIEIGLANGVTVDATTTEDGTQMLVTDPVGLVHLADGDTATIDGITDGRGNAPTAPVRSVRRVGNKVYAVGVDRQVFVRDAGKWCLASTKEMMTSTTPVAFQGVDGFSDKEIYAVGWGGEIWSYDGQAWRQRQSPTNIILNDICSGPEFCVAVGLAGQVFAGRSDDWDMIEHDETDDDFWSVRYFNDAYYLSATSGIYELKDGELTLFREIDEDMRTAFVLTVGDSGLWSIGTQDIVLFDGEYWLTIGQS